MVLRDRIEDDAKFSGPLPERSWISVYGRNFTKGEISVDQIKHVVEKWAEEIELTGACVTHVETIGGEPGFGPSEYVVLRCIVPRYANREMLERMFQEADYHISEKLFEIADN